MRYNVHPPPITFHKILEAPPACQQIRLVLSAVLNVDPQSYGGMAYATPITEAFNAGYAETADIDSAKKLSTSLIRLNTLKGFRRRNHIAPTAYL